MAITPTGYSGLIPIANFSNNSGCVIRNAHVAFADSDTGFNALLDSITLSVIDSDGTTQYFLTTEDTDPVIAVDENYVYSVDSIDISSFPSGDIELYWYGEYDGYDYTYSTTVGYGTASVTVVSGKTDTLEDFSARIGTAKTYTTRICDAIGNAYDGYAVQCVFVDRKTASEVEYIDATSISVGLYTVSHTLVSSIYSPDTDRYEIYWRIKFTNDSEWFEVQNTRHQLKVYGTTSDAVFGPPITYSSNDDIRMTFPGIDLLLSDVIKNQGEREILLNNKRLQASSLINRVISSSRVRRDRELLRMWECYEAYRLVLHSAMGFAKFSANDPQLIELEKQIKRIRSTIFGPVSTIRIGGKL